MVVLWFLSFVITFGVTVLANLLLVYSAFAKLQRIARASTINAMLSLYRTRRAFSEARSKELDPHFLLICLDVWLCQKSLFLGWVWKCRTGRHFWQHRWRGFLRLFARLAIPEKCPFLRFWGGYPKNVKKRGLEGGVHPQNQRKTPGQGMAELFAGTPFQSVIGPSE